MVHSVGLEKYNLGHTMGSPNFKFVEGDINIIIETITAIRNIKANLNISPGQIIHVYARGNKEDTNILKNNFKLLNRMAKIEELNVGADLKKPNQSCLDLTIHILQHSQIQLFTKFKCIEFLDVK